MIGHDLGLEAVFRVIVGHFHGQRGRCLQGDSKMARSGKLPDSAGRKDPSEKRR